MKKPIYIIMNNEGEYLGLVDQGTFWNQGIPIVAFKKDLSNLKKYISDMPEATIVELVPTSKIKDGFFAGWMCAQKDNNPDVGMGPGWSDVHGAYEEWKNEQKSGGK